MAGGEAKFSTTVQTGSGVHPASYRMGTGSFPGDMWPGRGAEHPPPSGTVVKDRVGIAFTPLLGLHGLLWG